MESIHKLVVIGCSMGGLQALKTLFTEIKPHPGLTFIVAQHLGEGSKGLLPEIIGRETEMECLQPIEHAPLEAGKVYFAKGGRHLLVEDGKFRYGNARRVGGGRPSIDQLFLSAAVEYKEKVIGVVLTGLLSDGREGMKSVMRYGGTTIVQDPKDAEFDEIPASTLQGMVPDFILPLSKIATIIDVLLGQVKVKSNLAAKHEDLEVLRRTISEESAQLPLPEFTDTDSLVAMVQLMQERCNMLENMIEKYLLEENTRLASFYHRRLQEANLHVDNIRKMLLQAQQSDMPVRA